MAIKTHQILSQIHFFILIQMNINEKKRRKKERQNKTNEILSDYQISNIKCE